MAQTCPYGNNCSFAPKAAKESNGTLGAKCAIVGISVILSHMARTPTTPQRTIIFLTQEVSTKVLS